MSTAAFAYPPFRMKRAEAARYCGMSESSFLCAIQTGKMPEGKDDVGGRYWLRTELEAAILDEEPALDEPKCHRTKRDFRKKI